MILSIVLLLLMMVNSCNGKANNPVVRPATQANRFYTGDPKELSAEVDSFLELHRGRTMYEHVAAVSFPAHPYGPQTAQHAFSLLLRDLPQLPGC